MAQRETVQSLIGFTKNVGVPETVITDGAGEVTGWNTEFAKHDRRMKMHIENLKPGRKNKNHAVDRKMGFLEKRWRRQMTNKVILKQLWYFGIFYKAELFVKNVKR